MFTIEMDFDETAITILDPLGQEEDVQVLMYDDIIYMRQWDDHLNRFRVITMSSPMYLELMRSFNLPEGSYMIETGENE